MNKICQLVGLVLLPGSLFFSSVIVAQDAQDAQDNGSSGSFLDVLKGAIGNAANEAIESGIEELSGTFDGDITDIRLVERRGRLAIFDVKYHKVKDTEGLQLVGEVLRGGAPSEDFSPAVSDISKKRGTVRVMFEKGGAAADEGWGIETESSPVETDQVRLTFVRDTHPDEPFGQYLFDFRKTWTDSDEPDDLTEQQAEEDTIALADGEQTAKPPLLVRPGMSIKPLVVENPVALAKSAATAKPAVTTNSTATNNSRIAIAPFLTVNKALTLNKYASKALWKSGAGKLAFPGAITNRQGYVRIIPEAKLSTGTKAADLLNTHPEWKARGFIEGTFPAMKLGKAMHLKTVIGFLQGATESDGARFIVSVKAGGKVKRIFAKRVLPQKYESVDIDLSAWSGKVIHLMFTVDAGAQSKQDYAVWVKPRLDIAP